MTNLIKIQIETTNACLLADRAVIYSDDHSAVYHVVLHTRCCGPTTVLCITWFFIRDAVVRLQCCVSRGSSCEMLWSDYSAVCHVVLHTRCCGPTTVLCVTWFFIRDAVVRLLSSCVSRGSSYEMLWSDYSAVCHVVLHARCCGPTTVLCVTWFFIRDAVVRLLS